MITKLHVALTLCMAAGTARGLEAQSLAERVRAVGDGTVLLRFAGRHGLCGDGEHYLSLGGRMRMGEFITGRNDPCLPGPVQVRLRVERGVVRDVHTTAGPVPGTRAGESVTDLGTVPARVAASFFLDLAATAEGRGGTGAVLPAVLADSTVVWRDLVRLARDRDRPRATRTDAAFWLSRFTSAKLEGRAEDLVEPEEEDERDGPRLAAVFALSQLRNDEAVPALVQVARTNRNVRVRRQALFWLGQSGDPRGIDLMEEFLRDR
jgi:hypothetical protein